LGGNGWGRPTRGRERPTRGRERPKLISNPSSVRLKGVFELLEVLRRYEGFPGEIFDFSMQGSRDCTAVDCSSAQEFNAIARHDYMSTETNAPTLFLNSLLPHMEARPQVDHTEFACLVW